MSKTFFVTLFSDTTVEPSGTVNLTLSSFVNGTPGAITSPALTIVDDDTPPAIGALGFQANGQFGMTLTGPIGQRFAIQVSSDLSNWMTVATVTNTTGTVPYVDPASASLSGRFYRAMILP